MSVDVYQNVNLSQIDLTHFPIQFGLIKGNFDCYHNQLESLIGAPHTVQGVFDITRHKLTSLKGGPKHVEQDYLAPNGSLVNLKYCAEYIGGKFDCSSNELTSLEGNLKILGQDFNCSSNQLANLKGSLEAYRGVFDCSSNKLNSLIGGPIEVDSFYCEFNQLTSLEYMPNNIGDHFYCNNNQLVDFDFCNLKSPFKVLSCHDNPFNSSKMIHFFVQNHWNLEDYYGPNFLKKNDSKEFSLIDHSFHSYVDMLKIMVEKEKLEHIISEHSQYKNKLKI